MVKKVFIKIFLIVTISCLIVVTLYFLTFKQPSSQEYTSPHELQDVDETPVDDPPVNVLNCDKENFNEILDSLVDVLNIDKENLKIILNFMVNSESKEHYIKTTDMEDFFWNVVIAYSDYRRVKKGKRIFKKGVQSPRKHASRFLLDKYLQKFINNYLPKKGNLKCLEIGGRFYLATNGVYSYEKYFKGPNGDYCTESWGLVYSKSFRIDDRNKNIYMDLDEHEFPSRFKKYFDVVIQTMVMEHVKHVYKTCENIALFLGENGRMIVTVPSVYTYHPEPEDNYRYTESGLRLMYKRYGNLCVVDEEVGGGIYSILAYTLGFSLAEIPPHLVNEIVKKIYFAAFAVMKRC